MRKWIYILPIIFVSITSCRKDKIIPTSGTITINNITSLGQTYYVYGFLFAQAKLVTTLNKPHPDITIDTDGTNLFFQAENLLDSFNNSGEYPNSTSAKSAFDILEVKENSVWSGLASPLKENQLWIYRSGTECYAKLRIISIVSDGTYAECTFEWVYQPDGSLTFPGK